MLLSCTNEKQTKNIDDELLLSLKNDWKLISLSINLYIMKDRKYYKNCRKKLLFDDVNGAIKFSEEQVKQYFWQFPEIVSLNNKSMKEVISINTVHPCDKNESITWDVIRQDGKYRVFNDVLLIFD